MNLASFDVDGTLTETDHVDDICFTQACSGHLEFVHNETGVRTLKQEFDKVATHNEHHLEEIMMALDAS